jgi:hypothetical protein
MGTQIHRSCSGKPGRLVPTTSLHRRQTAREAAACHRHHQPPSPAAGSAPTPLSSSLTPRPYSPCLPRILPTTSSTPSRLEPPSPVSRLLLSRRAWREGDGLMGTGRARALPLALALLLACSDVAVVAAQGTERIQGTRPLALPSFSCLLPRSG